MENIVLEKLGLNKFEVNVYLALLALGESSVLDVSKKAKTERAHTYRILESLIEKGLVSFVTEKTPKSRNTKRFKAASPEKILLQLREKEEAFLEVLPRLKKISQLNELGEPSVDIFRGMRGMKAMINEILELKVDFCMLGTDNSGKKIDFFVKNHMLKGMEKANLHERLLSKKGFQLMTSKTHSTVRFLPEEYPYLASTVIYGDRVGIVIWSDPFLAIRIISKELAETYKSYFEVMWAISKKE